MSSHHPGSQQADHRNATNRIVSAMGESSENKNACQHIEVVAHLGVTLEHCVQKAKVCTLSEACSVMNWKDILKHPAGVDLATELQELCFEADELTRALQAASNIQLKVVTCMCALDEPSVSTEMPSLTELAIIRVISRDGCVLGVGAPSSLPTPRDDTRQLKSPDDNAGPHTTTLGSSRRFTAPHHRTRWSVNTDLGACRFVCVRPWPCRLHLLFLSCAGQALKT